MIYSPIRQSYIVGSGKLVPESFEAKAQLDSIPVGERIDVVIYRERNPSFEGLFYKTMDLIGEAMKWRARNVRGWLAIKTGRADIVQWPPYDDERLRLTHVVPHGTGPADMNRAQLEVFWEDAREVARREVLPYVEADAAEQIKWRLDDLRDQ